jgi:hypothetical protein
MPACDVASQQQAASQQRPDPSPVVVDVAALSSRLCRTLACTMAVGEVAGTVVVVVVGAVAAVKLLVLLTQWWGDWRWSARRDSDGRPIKLLPRIHEAIPFGLGLTLRFAWATPRGKALALLAELLETHGLTCRLDVTYNDHAFVLTGDPEVVAWVTARRFENYDKGASFKHLFEPFLGKVRTHTRAHTHTQGCI